jgi:NADPH-dependent 2,4-dienoyl-CoA reductase/sulfur reductase-like enzyme
MKVAIIGGAASGMGVAAKLLRTSKDAQITVYQNHDYISLGACGLPYFISNNFDDENNMIARTPEFFQKNGVEMRINTLVVDIDFENKIIKYVDDHGEHTDVYDDLVIATGAKPIVPNEYNFDNIKNLFTLTSLEDGRALKTFVNDPNINHVLVIGAGFIGLEVVENLKSLQKEVTLIEMQDHIMGRQFETEYATAIKDILLEHDVKLQMGVKVDAVQMENGLAHSVTLSNGKNLAVDAIILCIGFRPNTSFLNGKLNMLPNGAIIVDEMGQTNIPHVYALGDCASSKNVITHDDEYVPLATVAAKFAKVVAENIAGPKRRFYGSLKTAIIRVFENGFARTGLTENDAKLKGMTVQVVTIEDYDHTNYVAGQQKLKLTIIYDVKNGVIVGAQMMGHRNAVLRIHSLITLIWNKVKITDYVEQMDLPYSPPFAKTNDIILIALSKIAIREEK